MATVKDMAVAFLRTEKTPSHPSVKIVRCAGGVNEYRLHGNLICEDHYEKRELVFRWCGWYTPTTANHMNTIIGLLGYCGESLPARRSYVADRKAGVSTFSLNY